VKRNTDPYVNKPGIPAPDIKTLAIKGVNLPTELTPQDIQIGELGEIEVTEIVENTTNMVKVKMKVLKCIPGKKTVAIRGIQSADNLLVFIKEIEDVPDTVVGEKRFGATRIVGTSLQLPLTLASTGQYIFFNCPGYQQYNITPVQYKSPNEIGFTTYGDCMNAGTFVYEGTPITGTETIAAYIGRVDEGNPKPPTYCNNGEKLKVKLEVFIDDKYSIPLTDWPETPDNPRSVRYLFGVANPIYVQVTGLGKNPEEIEEISRAVRVTSESDKVGIFLDLKETGPNTNVFRNVAKPLYLYYLSQEKPIYDIKVMDEEVLTFYLISGEEYTKEYEVMVDRAEIGVEWQGRYDKYTDEVGRLKSNKHIARDFANGLEKSSMGWFKVFANRDLGSKKSHWAAATDSAENGADTVDFALWVGHGSREAESPDDRFMRFFIDTKPGLEPTDKLHWSEIDWGDLDADWIVINTCRFLQGTDEQLKQMIPTAPKSHAVRLILSYATDMTEVKVAGKYFAELLTKVLKLTDFL
jgi:hypothetical protein